MADKGFKYETKMAVLIALRLFKKSQDFHLAKNWEEAEKFDDIVYSANINGKWETCFIQLKHRTKMTINLNTLQDDEAFRISKYISSFKTISKKFKNNSNPNCVIFSKNFEDAKFFIYTNAQLSTSLLERQREEVFFELLATNPDKNAIVKFNLINYKDVFPNMGYSKVLAGFVDKFYFLSKQADEKNLEDLIKRELEEFQELKLGLSFSTLKLCDDIEKWLDSNEFLTKSDLNYFIFQTILAIDCNKVRYLNLSFSPIFIKKTIDVTNNILSKFKVMILVSDADNCNIYLALLNKCNFFNEPNIVINISMLKNVCTREAIFLKWFSKEMTLILNCDDFQNDFNVYNFINYLYLKNSSNKVMIVATKISNVSQIHIQKFAYKISLLHFDEASKQQFLNKSVIFQGFEAKLSTLINMDEISLGPITQLLEGKPLAVGIPLSGQISYYVQRDLARQAISSSIFSDSQIDACFALSGISLEDANLRLSKFHINLSQLIICKGNITKEKIILLDKNPAKEYQELAKICKKPLYWLEKANEGREIWYWRNSTDGVEEIKRHVKGKYEYIPTESIMEITPKFVIVSAEPGMGKTTILNIIAKVIKKKNPNFWVLNVVLNDISEYLSKDFNEKDGALSVLQYLANINEKSTYFDIKIFETCYASGKMIVLLDGFDEISPYYTKNGLALIKLLKHSNVFRIWISTRPAMQLTLENHTSTLAYKIKPFDRTDQEQFLKQYWLGKIENNLYLGDINKFTEYVLEFVRKSFDAKLSQFTGIPLQTRMIAEVFFPHLQKYISSKILPKMESLNAVQLFVEFIQIKQDVQMEKTKGLKNNAAALSIQEKLNKILEEELIHLGLLTIFPQKTCQNLTPGLSKEKAEELKEAVNDCTEKTGLIVSFKGGSPQFIHRTFAEYFVALYFTKHFSTNKEFLSSSLFTERLEFVKRFFDSILAAGCPLHEALLNGDINEVQKLVASKSEINKKDKGGRTPLHIAASMSDPQFAILLVEAGAKIKIKDTIFNWKPMDYTLKIGVIENIGSILEITKEELNADAVEMSWETLLKVLQKDYLQLFIHFIKNGINSIENLKELSKQKWINQEVHSGLTILHLAAAYDSMKILNYLLTSKFKVLLEKRSSGGLTPLLLAGSMGKLDAVKSLIKAKADLLATDPNGKNLLQLVVECKGSEIRQFVDDASFRNAYLSIISLLLP